MRNSIVACLALSLTARAAVAQRTFRRAAVDSAGQVRIVLSNHHVIRPQKDSNQVAFDRPAVSPDRRTVGWLALYPNCCTTYPIPLELVLLRADGARTVIGGDLPIWQWGFAADGRSVVVRRSPVHGDAPVYYERRDIRTGRLTATARADGAAPGALPAWTRSARSSAEGTPPRFRER
jgi:hypothetical protein